MKKNHLLLLILLLTLGALFTSCKSYSEKAEALPELVPALTENQVRVREEDPMIPPVIGMIAEIEVIRGEQRFIYVKFGKKNKGIKVGLKGYVYNDAQMKEQVGKVEIIEVYSNLSKVKVLELNYRVNQGGVVKVEVDPRAEIK